MKRVCLALMMLIILTAQPLLAQHIPDLSLSPEETSHQPNISNNKQPQMFQNDVTRRATAMEHKANAAIPGYSNPGVASKQSFMEGYCDPSFIPVLANNRKYYGQEQCLQAQRDDACARFGSLQPEVKSVLDEAIGCMFTNGNSYAAEDSHVNDNDYISCGSSYARRIDMLKKYSADAYAAYALIYLPDTVLDTAGQCSNRR